MNLPFPVRFGFLGALLLLLVERLPASLVSPLSRHTAQVLAATLNALGLEARASGTLVWGSGFAVRVIPECTALYPAALFFAFVLASTAPRAVKAAGIPAGWAVLYLFNAVRLTALFLTGVHGGRFFPIGHTLLGEIATALAVGLACLAWRRAADSLDRPWPYCRPGRLFTLAAAAAVLCLLWWPANRIYQEGIDRLVAALFQAFGYRLHLPHGHTIYSQTFNVPALAAVAVACRGLRWAQRLKALWLALAAAAALHFAFRAANALLTAFNVSGAFAAAQFCAAVGHYLLPLLLWLRLSGKRAGQTVRSLRPPPPTGKERLRRGSPAGARPPRRKAPPG